MFFFAQTKERKQAKNEVGIEITLRLRVILFIISFLVPLSHTTT